MAGYESDIKVSGKSYDPDIRPENYINDTISLKWECKNLNDDNPCSNSNGELIPLAESQEITIAAKQLTPYQAYVLTLTGEKGIQSDPLYKSSSGIITLVITEIDLPALEVAVPSYLRSRKINTNEDIKIQLVYPDTNPDTLFYSGIFVYKQETVAVLVFEYLEFKF